MLEEGAKIYIAGHEGMVGSAILRHLKDKGYSHFALRGSRELDLRDQNRTREFFEAEKPDYVFIAAAKVGGIKANNEKKAVFVYDNLMIQSNLIHQAYMANVKKLLFLGSACIYPKLAPQPLREEYLLSGYLEPTNEPYAVAKIAGLKMIESYRYQYGCNFISAMPTNLYGVNDNFDPDNSHVLAALLRKFHLAKKNNTAEVVVWGTGMPKREFMHADDLAEACIWLMQQYDDGGFINIGTGEDISISDLAHLIKEIVGFEGKIVYDTTKPDGTPRRLLDTSRLNAMGWYPKIKLREGIQQVYNSISNESWY